MPYRFLANSTVEANVQRILNEQLDDAIAQLSETMPAHPERAIHNARKSLKKARSLLRLVRPSLDRQVYAETNDQMRALGQVLSSARDGAVYQSALDNLLKTYALTLDDRAFEGLRTHLAEVYQARLAALSDRDRALDPLLDGLKDTKAQLARLALNHKGWKVLAKGVKLIYHQGRSRFEFAYENGSDEAFHDWRKRVKDLWHGLRLLRPLWPPVMKAFEAEAHHLSELLGEGHDIAALRQFLTHQGTTVAVDELSMQVLMPLLEHRQHKLHQQAKVLGHQLYGEAPQAFTDRLGSYWASTHSD